MGTKLDSGRFEFGPDFGNSRDCSGQARADVGLGRHKQLYAVPAPGKVTIDGKLDDWDLSGQIEMYVVSETKDVQSAKFALMYDHEAFTSAE